jgi:hypothetical protein
MARWIRFLIAILVGAGIGLAYGWLIAPAQYRETTPENLRVDYKTDYVLMVADAYQKDANLDQALRQLAALGGTSPVDTVYQAVLFAQKVGYAPLDIDRIQALLNSLQAQTTAVRTPRP